jgi:hypothetical protein
MLTLREELPGDRPLRCYARRGLSAQVRCEQNALHYLNHGPMSGIHIGRDRAGKWHHWPVVPERNYICQVNNVNTGWLVCRANEAVYRCEALGPHDRHVFGQHTIFHAKWGNENSCEAIERRLAQHGERD